jgi:hypothetical protein
MELVAYKKVNDGLSSNKSGGGLVVRALRQYVLQTQACHVTTITTVDSVPQYSLVTEACLAKTSS